MKLSPFCLVAIAAALLHVGCGGGGSRMVDRVVGHWRLFALEGSQAPKVPAITLELRKDGTMTGTGGCNRYTTTFEIGDDDSLTLGEVSVTPFVCAESVLKTEARFLAALEGAVSVKVSSRFLDFEDSGGRPRLRFERDSSG